MNIPWNVYRIMCKLLGKSLFMLSMTFITQVKVISTRHIKENE